MIFQDDIVRRSPDSPYLHVPVGRPRSNSTYSSVSFTPSIRSTYSTQWSYSEEYQCSDPAEIFRFREKWSSIVPILRDSWFLRMLFLVFLFYISMILFSVVLIVFSIWLWVEDVVKGKKYESQNRSENLFSCNEQLKKWCCHSVRPFVRSFVFSCVPFFSFTVLGVCCAFGMSYNES